MFRLQSGSNLYTLEEVPPALQRHDKSGDAVARRRTCAAAVFVGTACQSVPWAAGHLPVATVHHSKRFPSALAHNQLQDSPLYKITKVVEELNRGLVRMIDQLWNDRRERLLLAARILKDLEKVIRT